MGSGKSSRLAIVRARPPPRIDCMRRSLSSSYELDGVRRGGAPLAGSWPATTSNAGVEEVAMPESAARDLWDNPMGTDGFEFVEYTGPEPAQLAALFERMGFVAAARHRSKNVTLYKQGDVNFIVNAEPESFAQAFARLHGPSVCAIAFRVKDAASEYDRAIKLRPNPAHGKLGPMELNIPAIAR